MKKMIATFAVLSIASFAIAQDGSINVGVAAGDGTMAMVNGAMQGATGSTTTNGVNVDWYDFVVSSDNDWTNSEANLSVTGSSFWYASGAFAAPAGDAPVGALVGVDPEIQFHTFGAGPNQFPNNPTGAAPASPTPGSTWGADSISAGYFDTSNDGAISDLVNLRLVVEATGDYVISGVLDVFTTGSGGVATPFNFEIVVPEPGTFALLALGGLAGLIRRR